MRKRRRRRREKKKRRTRRMRGKKKIRMRSSRPSLLPSPRRPPLVAAKEKVKQKEGVLTKVRKGVGSPN